MTTPCITGSTKRRRPVRTRHARAASPDGRAMASSGSGRVHGALAGGERVNLTEGTVCVGGAAWTSADPVTEASDPGAPAGGAVTLSDGSVIAQLDLASMLATMGA